MKGSPDSIMIEKRYINDLLKLSGKQFDEVWIL